MGKLKNALPKIDSQFHGSSYITKPGTNYILIWVFRLKKL